ncbi:ABC transporter ATP-binding protein [Arhodomonas sp. AD133]|uniref:ABC transporter ATP-binding protein n=1 Tax=Arhodomonas sp. AD133 TaxID=3415009 RepID=UPI003EBB9F0A
MDDKGDDILLQVDDLHVDFHLPTGVVEAVRGVSFDIRRGETVALVGESGSGKSVTSQSILRLLPDMARHPKGAIRYHGDDLLKAPLKHLRAVRGNRIAMIFQEPMTSLNPVQRVGAQIEESLGLHRGLKGQPARQRVQELLELVGIPEPQRRARSYPHELSGGQRQRVMIAMALACDPELLIADEPTTALDVTIQAQILALLNDLKQRLGLAILFITHDLGIVRRFADRVCVMRYGEIVETGDAEAVFANPRHEYTRMLVDAEPSGHKPPVPDTAPVLLRAEDVHVRFPIRQRLFRRDEYFEAVRGISLTLRQGQTVGVVGESGSGKSTLGRAILRLVESEGDILFEDASLQALDRDGMRPVRRRMQVVFQDPYGSLSPRLTVGEVIAEGLSVHYPELGRREREQRVCQILHEVGLDDAMRNRYPHEFSGGQRQRIAVARALILQPRFLLLDEPTSALDRSVQARVVDLLRDLQARHALTYLFISHDLAVVRALSDYIVVMNEGRVVEQGPAEEVFDHPREAYTRALMDAAFNVAVA